MVLVIGIARIYSPQIVLTEVNTHSELPLAVLAVLASGIAVLASGVAVLASGIAVLAVLASG